MTDVTTEQLINQGFAAHQAGDLSRAEAAYREVLSRASDNPRALHLLGVLAYQVGQPDAALELIRRAIDVNPAVADFHGHLGLVLAAQGRTAEAVVAYRRALDLAPDFPDVHNNLGNALKQIGSLDEAIAAYRRALHLRPEFPEAQNNLGLALHDAGQFNQAVDAFRQSVGARQNDPEAWNNLGNALLVRGDRAEAVACFVNSLELRPRYPEALNNLGNALKQSARNDEAAIAFRQALNLRPEFPEALNNLGLVLQSEGRSPEAIDLYRRALSHRDAYPEAHYNLAIALRAAGDLAGATAACRRAVELRPTFAQALNNLGILLQEQGELGDALEVLGKAIEAAPDYAEGHSNLGNVFRQLGKLKEAVGHYRRAVTLRPDYAEAHSNLGIALQQSGRMGEAIASFRRALELRPAFPEAFNNLGNVFKEAGELDEAIACYERACALAPDDTAADSNRVYTLHFHSGYGPEEILQEHLRWNERHAASLWESARPHENDPLPQRRLRIGYVSPDFRDHCQSMFTLPLLAHHDHKAFEVFCYADVARPDATTARLRGHADVWRSTVGLTDVQVAELVRRDRIDILIDLTLHMSNNRLGVFARKPAPVQVTWLGYPGTTGLETMDYRLTDPHLDPPGGRGEAGSHDRFYSEESVRLPDSFWCYDPLATGPQVGPLPALKNRHVTFGCLNNFCKVTGRTLGLWGQVLAAVPDSRLLVLVPRGPARERLLENLGEYGVGPTRVEFVDRQPRDKYLAVYNRIDVGLDTFPYNGHTTTLDALWMGVPVTTIVGRTAVGRGGWSQLSNLGLRELAARSDKQFVRNAIDLASDLDRLSRLRAMLRDRLTQSPLADAPRFAANVEAAYGWMWRRWTTSRTQGFAASA